MGILQTSTPVKRSVSGVFLAITFFLMLFPFIQTFNEFLVKIGDLLVFLRPAQDLFIGYEARLVRLFLGFLAIPTEGQVSSPIISLVGKSGGLNPVAIAWGCSGWQSLVLIITTIFAGIQGNFTTLSKLETIFLGVVVTFWINIFRLTTIYFLFYHQGRENALLFHDYGSIVLTIIWLFTFWWFSFKFVLVKKV